MITRFALLAVLILALAGCRNSAQTPESDPNVNITLTADALTVGETIVRASVADADGKPLAAEKFAVRGDMNHAGMTPVLAEAPAAGDETEIPFAWTMAGDWIVTVTVTLAGGETAVKIFNFSVQG